MNPLARVLVSAVALWLADVLLDGVHVLSPGGFWPTVGVLVVVAVVFTLVNAVVKPVVAILALPLYLLTLGLFTVVVNALMLMLTAWLTGFLDWGLEVRSFGWALVGSLIVSLATLLLRPAVKKDQHRSRR